MTGERNPANGNLLNPQPVATIYASHDGQESQIMPEQNLDIDGDGQPDRVFPVAQIPDGAQFNATDSNGASKTLRVRALDITTVPKRMPSPFTQCNSLTLRTANPDPTTLTCGALAANAGQPCPTLPSKMTWKLGVWGGYP